MRQSGAMTTCVPLEFDQGGWQSTVFFELGGKECKEDRRLLRKTTSPLAIGIEADIIEHTNAAVVMLRFEVMTTRDNPLVGEVLLAPDHQRRRVDHRIAERGLPSRAALR